MPTTANQILDFLDDAPELAPAPELGLAPIDRPKKSKKLKKSKKDVAPAQAGIDVAEDALYTKWITPPQLADEPVDVEPAALPPHTDLFSPDADKEATWLTDPERSAPQTSPTIAPPPPASPPPPLPIHNPSRAPLPKPISPTPASTKVVSPATSPQPRPASLHGGFRQHAGYRANVASALPPPQQQQQQQQQQQRDSLAVSPRPRFVDPPPPHMPQAHFFALPDLGLNLNPKQEPGKPAGSDGYCCCFDSFGDAGDAASARKAKDALLVGSEGGLDVYRVLSDKLEVVGRLEGLHGAVIGAKVLPHVDLDDAWRPLRPLIAVIVHGFMVDDRADSGRDDETAPDFPSHCQTTVDVYSLQNQRHVATLYKSVPLAIERLSMGHVPRPSAPVGDLRLDAQGNFITLASGKSGEVFVFSSACGSDVEVPQFRCIGKFWTALQAKQDVLARPTSPGDISTTGKEMEKEPGVPLFSLSSRWLAIVPPYSSASISIQGSPILASANPNPPGLTTHVAPIQPVITCEVVGTDPEDTLSWLSRKAAQGLVKASQKGFEMGLQGWKELTHPSPPSTQQHHQRTANREQDMFPPTNATAEDPRRLAKEPALVSMIDLRKISDGEEYKSKSPPVPLATFALVEGCNFVSFSPEGLMLLTANRKGEVSTVWDIRHVAHGSPKLSLTDDGEVERGPYIKQIHRMARSSPSIILDTVWSRDGGWLALLTTHGTVHLHEVPLDAPRKRSKRRNTFSTLGPDKAEPTVSVSHGMSPPSGNGIWGTFRSSLQSVSTQVNAIRSQGASSNFPIPTTFAGLRDVTAAARSASGRVVARSISQGYSAAKGGASDMWHAEDNKIRLKLSPETPARTARVSWVQRRDSAALTLAYAGTVSLHPIQRVTRRKGDTLITSLKHEKAGQKTFSLPRLSAGREGGSGTPAVLCADEGPHGFWSLRPVTTTPDEQGTNRATAVTRPGAPANDVETNPPYCPFHIDPRVSIFAFDEGSAAGELDAWQYRGHGVDEEEPWLFGDSLPPSTKMNERSQSGADALALDRAHHASDADLGDGDGVAGQVESTLTIHPVTELDGREHIRVVTQRSRGGARGDEAGFQTREDEDGEEDEDAFY